MTKTHKHYLGKCDYNNSGRKNHEAYITWTFDGARFSMCAEVWKPSKRDIVMGGQCVDTVAAYFPADKLAQRMVAIWRAWHLNDMTAGSPAQEAWLKANPLPEGERYDYARTCERLQAAGLLDDASHEHNGKPYRYGSAWLKRDIPDDVAAEITGWDTLPPP